MTDPERRQLREEIQQCQERRRFGTLAIQQPPGDAPETQASADVQTPYELEQESDWEKAIREERLSLLAM